MFGLLHMARHEVNLTNLFSLALVQLEMMVAAHHISNILILQFHALNSSLDSHQ